MRILLAALIILWRWPAGEAQETPNPPPPESPPTQPHAITSNGNSIDVSNGGTVELHVVNMPLGEVLRLLSIKGKRNIVATPAVKGTVTADFYSVSFESALRAVLAANNCDYQQRGDFIYVQTLEEFGNLQSAKDGVVARVFYLNYTAATDIEKVVTPLLGPNGTIAKSPEPENGLQSTLDEVGGASLAGQDYIVVYDRPERLENIARLIRQVDVKPLQVLVEATILRARLTDDNALGIDFTLLAGVDLELLGATSRGIQGLTLGNLPNDRYERFNANASTTFTDNVPDGGLTFGIIKDNVAIFIRALEEITDTTVLANPKVLTLNKQIGNVIVGRRDGYITTTVTETQAVQKVEFLETGTQLTFRPYIGTDGFVRMELHPEDSVGGLTAAQLPFEQTTEITTNVIVRDGNTILIGGLFREVSSESRAQLPFLGDIPGLGDLFRSRSDSVDREEVIILLTCHVVKDDNAYAQMTQEYRQNVERIRSGLQLRRMWHGRDAIAQAHYRRALDYFNHGDNDHALAQLDLVLHNSPRFVPAMKLKESITQKRDWSEDGAGGRDFIYRLIMREQGIDEPSFGRPGPPFKPNPTQPMDETSDSPAPEEP